MSYKAGNLEVELLTTYNDVSKTIDNVNKKLNNLSKQLEKNNKELGKLKKNTGSTKGTTKGTSGKSGGLGFLDKISLLGVFYIARKIGNVVADIAQSGADYTETLNLWETAMGENVDLASEFVDKMNEAYGISEKTLMNAQAIFKNMLGSLGNITDQMAYQLSEGITQMAVDYASLYNVTFDKAFQKFQSALAGQVKPIRSISGYDITENTLYQLYQSIGGTKSMRQLNRTEKQLLAILAIFRQMSTSGAIGDLDKTMESFANQSRVMAEAWEEVKTYAGILLTYTLQESGVLKFINATLLFLGDLLKGIAEEVGAIQSFGGYIFGSTTESALEASDAIDELNGKLLDFDKFRSLSSEEENSLALDEKLLQALSGYDTILGDASNSARELAKSFKEMSGLFDEDGALNPEKWEELKIAITGFAIALGAVGAFFTIYGLIKLLTSPLGAIVILIGTLTMNITTLISKWSDMNTWQKIFSVLSTLISLLSSVGAIIFAIKGDWVKALLFGALAVTSTIATSQTANMTPKKYAEGGMPDKGTMFIAGEAGAKMVYNTPSGQSGVANIQQIEQAMYGALVRYGKTQGANGQAIVIELDGEKVYQNTTAHAKKRGNVWGKA